MPDERAGPRPGRVWSERERPQRPRHAGRPGAHPRPGAAGGQAAVDVKADEVKILDMHELVTYTDYLVLCTGRNTRLTRRIAEEVGFKLKQQAGLLPGGHRGRRPAGSGSCWTIWTSWCTCSPRGAGVLPAGRAVEAGAGRDRGREGRGTAPRLGGGCAGVGPAAIIRGRPWGYSSVGRARRWQR